MSKMPKTKTQHKSMRGKIIDMNILQKKNELTPAIGNARVNARGDELGAGGKIVKKREDVVKEHYAKNSVVRDTSGRARGKQAVTDAPAEIKAEELTKEEIDLLKDLDDEDWVEDDEGNFVQKGK